MNGPDDHGGSRFPFPLPYGWFSVGRLDELPDDPVVRIRAVGRDLVVWRDGDERHVFDAYCPHLGAHLGVGGRVIDGCLVCPFHEWSFGSDGTNVAIPYAERPNRKAKVRTYPTIERNRQLLFWYHPDPAVAPLWDIPEALPEAAVECLRFSRRVRSVWQELSENSVDMSHFVSVHGLSQIGQIGEMTMDGPIRRVHSNQSFKTARGEFEGAIQSTSYGPGVGVVQFELMTVVTLVSTNTPIENGEIEVRFTLYHPPGDEVAGKIGAAFGAEVERQFDQDIPIWEAKQYQPSPALAPSEKAITEFRRWASQFYAETPA
jgi:nitrite reductase/ring-hydroxylating ferredoxin subunit